MAVILSQRIRRFQRKIALLEKDEDSIGLRVYGFFWGGGGIFFCLWFSMGLVLENLSF